MDQELISKFKTFDELLGPDPSPVTELPKVSVEELLTALYSARYTGSLHLEFRNGRARVYTVDPRRRGRFAP